MHLPVVDAYRHQVGFVVVEDLTSRRLLRLAEPVIEVVVAVEPNLDSRIAQLVTLQQLLFEQLLKSCIDGRSAARSMVQLALRAA